MHVAHSRNKLHVWFDHFQGCFVLETDVNNRCDGGTFPQFSIQ